MNSLREAAVILCDAKNVPSLVCDRNGLVLHRNHLCDQKACAFYNLEHVYPLLHPQHLKRAFTGGDYCLPLVSVSPSYPTILAQFSCAGTQFCFISLYDVDRAEILGLNFDESESVRANYFSVYRKAVHNIINVLPNLENKFDDLCDYDGRKIIDSISKQTLLMTRANDELDILAQLRSQSLIPQYKNTHLHNFLEDACESCRRILASQGVSLVSHIQTKDAISAIDENLFLFIVLSLITNSIIYNTAYSTVTVDAKVVNEFLVITISDTGFGMSEDQLLRAIRPFYSFHPEKKDQRSTGLGLPLSIELAHLMGGSLQIESQPNVGTVATLSLPILYNDGQQVEHLMSGPSLLIDRFSPVYIHMATVCDVVYLM